MSVPSVTFDAWPMREVWLSEILRRYGAVCAPVREQAGAPVTLSASMLDCFESGRAFSFWHVPDVERVALRDAWDRMRNAPNAADWGM